MEESKFTNTSVYLFPRSILEHDFKNRIKKMNNQINDKKTSKEKRRELINFLKLMNKKRPAIVVSKIKGNVILIPLTTKEGNLNVRDTHIKINVKNSSNENSYAKISMPINISLDDFKKHHTRSNMKISFSEREKIIEALISRIDRDKNVRTVIGSQNTSSSKTIYSLVTKPINQNVGIVRISGPRAFEGASKLVNNFEPKHNTVKFEKIHGKDGYIDDALVLTFIGPNSFTGENVIEIQSHGSMFVIQKIISELNDLGLEQSEPGEFMKQAYMNGKLDLSQTEAINTLILSENKSLTEKSLENLNGKQSSFINDALNKLGDVVSRIQVSIDYPENTDLPEYNLQVIGESIEDFKEQVKEIVIDSQRLVNYSKGIKIALVGIPNAGKSTLLNTLLKEDRAIVSDIEGTTRDVIDSITYIDGLKVTLQDTAGIRSETNDVIEQEGIKRSISTIEKADIVLVLLDGTKDIQEQKDFFGEIIEKHSNKIIEVITKADIKQNDGINISNDESSLNVLLDAIKEFVKENVFDEEHNKNSLLITQSQVDNFASILNSLEIALGFIKANETPDVVAFELEQSMKQLGKIIGKEIDQNYLTDLFANFCIGK